MRAIVVEELGGPDVLKVQETDRPAIEKNEVLIKVEAASVNFADIKARQGAFHGVSNSAFIPGLDCMGVIEETGADVSDLHKGQRVVAFPTGGSYAEYVKANENVTYVLPDDVDSDTAAGSLLVGVTSYNVLRKVARLEKGETVLIHAAAGGIGTTAAQLAKIYGAGKVIGTVGSDKKAAAAREAGVDLVINYKEEDFVKQTMDATDGKGVDVILDTIAGENFDKSLECLAPFGRIVTFGHANDESAPGNVKTNELHASCRSVLGYSTGTCIKQRPEFLKEAAAETIRLLAEKKLDILVSQSYPLEQASEAHTFMESRNSTGKLLLKP
ncbi:quinone oxidoreductase family protein [Bacillus piscicola]|uniref:quinone oxidoreductase family protein n=1 Tax=Bacillus piscicola TaxID=1632684 RepID=UPI001F094178|nr:zinc-binding dehydrogenase [Bacillus piscicola]